jgi:hypothetical protein
MGLAPPLWELDLRFGDAGRPPVPGPRPELHLRLTSASREFRSRWPPSAGAPKGEDRLTIVWHGQTLLFPRVPPVWRARALRRPDGAVQDSLGRPRRVGRAPFRSDGQSPGFGAGPPND